MLQNKHYQNLKAKFIDTFEQFISLNDQLRSHLQTLAPECFLYTYNDNHENDTQRQLAAKENCIRHCCAYEVINPGSDDHPSTSERETGVVFDDNPLYYTQINEVRLQLAKLIKESQIYRIAAPAQSNSYNSKDGTRSAIHGWFDEIGYHFIRTKALTRTFVYLPNPFETMTIGVWQNVAWRPINAEQIRKLCATVPNLDQLISDAKLSNVRFYRNQRRLSTRALIWEKGQLKPRRQSLALPIICHRNDHNIMLKCLNHDNNMGRKVSGYQTIEPLSSRFQIFYKNIDEEMKNSRL